MGDPILIATNGGFNFYVGNGPGANGAYRGIDEPSRVRGQLGTTL